LVVGDRRLKVLAGGSLGAARLGVEHVLYPARCMALLSNICS
jgi:hypothetical protein